tara:strand:+ start:448 stop:744 length:297 start_codon:yes stop_codon:yes gene_type:complete
VSKKLENFIEEATRNVTDDRAATKTLLMAIMKYMQTGDDRHREVGLIAAKYLETLQRSNEQLVKIAAIVQKKQNKEEGISDKDKQELFDLINSENEIE